MSSEWDRAIQGCTKPSLNIVTEDVLTEGSKAVDLGLMSVNMPWPVINTSNASTKVDDYVDQTGEFVSCAINNYNVKPIIEKLVDQASQVDYNKLIDDIQEDMSGPFLDAKKKALDKIKSNTQSIRSSKNNIVSASTTIMIILSCFVTLIGGLFIFLAISRNAIIGSILIITLLIIGYLIARYIINPKIKTKMNRFYCKTLRAESIDSECDKEDL